ncbi:DEAD/DEAH box helicase [Opitutaceae bacterium EW11]|nr:DEAD/DEAH box helicase [Opitutaceae bacterium EW11]
MVDFSKRLNKPKRESVLDPVEIYAGLDRKADKGELRKVQAHVLSEWHKRLRTQRDVIVKLHTGQGKTLIGLLLLQSKLNEKGGRVAYLCPTIQLIEQTYNQALDFGFKVCKPEQGEPLPAEFHDGKAILITSVQKLFNGRTQFKLHHQSLALSALVMDDSHACVDSIRDAVSLRVPRSVYDSKGKVTGTHPIYEKLFNLFSGALREQGEGTFQEIEAKKANALLAVPYWAWKERVLEVTRTIAGHDEDDLVKFVWPIIKDRLAECLCVISGAGLEITPYLAPLEDFGSFWKAETRIFMSATVTDDSFLIKGLRLSPETITKPLTYPKESWSGEKMILIPSLIDDQLDRGAIVKEFGEPNQRRTVGVAALVPSFKGTKDWEKYGATIARKDTIEDALNALRTAGRRAAAVVFVNRYDGIDLPDDSCRLLIFDGMPYGESLIDQYLQASRGDSESSSIRLARSIEQGLGRSVRGEKDFSVVLVVGTDLVDFVRQRCTRAYLSDQTRQQIEIGLETAEAATEEIKAGKSPMTALRELIQQCIGRDQGWKDFYVERMDQLKAEEPKPKGLKVFESELEAETEYLSGNVDRAIKTLQDLLDTTKMEESERGFYLQEMARYQDRSSKAKSNEYQKAAHKKNRFLFKPVEGFTVEKLAPAAGKRAANIAVWVSAFESFEQLKLAVELILTNLSFGVAAETFEKSLQKLGAALGYTAELPDRQWKAGPDNLWCLQQNDYLLIECKSEVLTDRAEIYKEESGQMNNACGWFHRNYPGANLTRLLVIPTNKLGHGAAFNESVGIVRGTELSRLVRNVRAFFQEFSKVDLHDLNDAKIQEFLVIHKLTNDEIKSGYQKDVYAGSVR